MCGENVSLLLFVLGLMLEHLTGFFLFSFFFSFWCMSIVLFCDDFIPCMATDWPPHQKKVFTLRFFQYINVYDAYLIVYSFFLSFFFTSCERLAIIHFSLIIVVFFFFFFCLFHFHSFSKTEDPICMMKGHMIYKKPIIFFKRIFIFIADV